MQAVAIFYGTQLNIVLYSSLEKQQKEKIVYLQWIFDEFMCLELEIVLWSEMKRVKEDAN